MSARFGASKHSETCWISLVCSPGTNLCGKREEGVSNQLSSMMLAYADEILHNIYCQRLFVWEQVGGCAHAGHVTVCAHAGHMAVCMC